MSKSYYSDEELQRYFSDPAARKRAETPARPERKPGVALGWVDGFRHTASGQQALRALGSLALAATLFAVLLGIYFLTLADDMPSLQQIEAPTFQLATVAYTADGIELQRYARQNRSWATFDEISPNVVNALVATEDHRFENHWGIDVIRTAAIPFHVLRGDPQGGSTLSQQLARNLYNTEIGKKVTVERKLKEMVTAVQLERRYTKREIIEMYLNTVEFGNNAFGIDAAARTFFGKPPSELNELESATLVGMLQAISYYNPIRNPENARRRRNVVLSQMVKRGHLSEAFYAQHREDPVETDYRSSEITKGLAPYFAEHVRNWLGSWARENGYDLYSDGLVVYTTLDSRLQRLAQESVASQIEGLQAVVDYEWSRAGGYELGTSVDDYLAKEDYEPFSYFWSSQKDVVEAFVRETPHFRSLRSRGLSEREALAELEGNQDFSDSLRAAKTRLEAGFVAIDPRNGLVKAWVGGRDLSTDWFDHVALAKRQPGSTFKPFVYTAAIDNGYSPFHMLKDSTFTYIDDLGNEWRPENSGDPGSGELITLREGLARSKNTVTGRLILLISPREAAFYARRMGIKSRLDEVPSLALGTSEVSLLEITSAYGTLASGGLYHEPQVVTRIEDKFGNVLYESRPEPHMAISEETAYVVVDMMRDVIRQGTGIGLNYRFDLYDYDLAGKTGTTQFNADGWFIGMHPELIVGGWIGFNDQRVAFRSSYWGQGAHTALFPVGYFFKRALTEEEYGLNPEAAFPTPAELGIPMGGLGPVEQQRDFFDERTDRRERGRVGW